MAAHTAESLFSIDLQKISVNVAELAPLTSNGNVDDFVNKAWKGVVQAMWYRKTAFGGVSRCLDDITDVLYELQQSTAPGAVGAFISAQTQFDDRLRALCNASVDDIESDDGKAASKNEFKRIKRLITARLSQRASRQREKALKDRKKGKWNASITVLSIYCASVMSYRLIAVTSTLLVAATREASADTSVVRGETCISVASNTVVPSSHFHNAVTEVASSLPSRSSRTDAMMGPSSVPSAGWSSART